MSSDNIDVCLFKEGNLLLSTGTYTLEVGKEITVNFKLYTKASDTDSGPVNFNVSVVSQGLISNSCADFVKFKIEFTKNDIKYACTNNECIVDPNGPFWESTCLTPPEFGFCQPPLIKYKCLNGFCTPDKTGIYNTPDCSGTCPPIPTHNACIDKVCIKVDGQGTDECSNLGGACSKCYVPIPLPVIGSVCADKAILIGGLAIAGIAAVTYIGYKTKRKVEKTIISAVV